MIKDSFVQERSPSIASPSVETHKATYFDPNLYMLSPHTHILSVAAEYRMVYMLDMSASLATLDPATGTVLISQVLET
jgi:hypothetical protein